MNPPQRIGKYEILAEIGRGGFAVVYKARDPALDREIALKVLKPEHVQADRVQQFLTEARQAARLTHPGIVPIYEVAAEDGQPYIAMAYLPGGSLAQRLAGALLSEARLPVEMALDILKQVAEALTYAHKKKLLHRDVKPANILFDEENRALLADFGLVKSLAETGMTSIDRVIGTREYMAPEQWNNGELSPATDIYALGVVAYELLAGRRPFEAETLEGLLYAHLQQTPPDPREWNADLDAGLVEVLQKALAKDPAARYASARDFACALKETWDQRQHAAETQHTLIELYHQAQEALQEQRWGTLVNHCVAIRNLDPDYRDAGTLLALAASHLAEEENARQQQKALEQAFTNAQALAREDPEKAVPALEALAEQAPEWQEVQVALEAARAAAEKQRLYASMAAHLKAACYDAACTELLAFLELEPEHTEARARLLEIAAALVEELQTTRAALEKAEGNVATLQARLKQLETTLAQLQEAHQALEQHAADADKALEQSLSTAQQQEKALRTAQQQVTQYDELLLTLEQNNLERARSLAQTLAKGKGAGATAVWTRLRPVEKPVVPATPQGERRVNPKDGKEYVRIPAGEFLYGDAKEKKTLPEYWIARTPVTNAEYARFVTETRREPPEHWNGKTPPKEIADHPVVNVTWEDAVAYAEWAGGRLPTEEEWEKAARGTDGCEYPWGGTFDKDKCNSEESGINGTTPVGKYSPDGDSPYGVADMAGNVWEWTASEFDKEGRRVVRGGAFSSVSKVVRCAFRYWHGPDGRGRNQGFRVVLSLSTL